MAATKPNRTRVLLLILLALMVYVVWRGGLSGIAGGASPKAESQVALGDRLEALQALPAILLDRPAALASYDGGRNLFDYTENPEVLRERARQRAKREEERHKREQQQQQARERQLERAAQTPREPAKPRVAPAPDFRYQYVGYFGRFTEPMEYLAVLTRAGATREVKKDDIRTVRVGDIVDDKFVIRKIDIDSVVVGYTNPKYREQTKTINLVLPQQSQAGKGRRR